MSQTEQILNAAISHTTLKRNSEMYGELLIIGQNYCSVSKNSLKPSPQIFQGIVAMANSAQMLLAEKQNQLVNLQNQHDELLGTMLKTQNEQICLKSAIEDVLAPIESEQSCKQLAEALRQRHLKVESELVKLREAVVGETQEEMEHLQKLNEALKTKVQDLAKKLRQANLNQSLNLSQLDQSQTFDAKQDQSDFNIKISQLENQIKNQEADIQEKDWQLGLFKKQIKQLQQQLANTNENTHQNMPQPKQSIEEQKEMEMENQLLKQKVENLEKQKQNLNQLLESANNQINQMKDVQIQQKSPKKLDECLKDQNLDVESSKFQQLLKVKDEEIQSLKEMINNPKGHSQLLLKSLTMLTNSRLEVSNLLSENQALKSKALEESKLKLSLTNSSLFKKTEVEVSKMMESQQQSKQHSQSKADDINAKIKQSPQTKTNGNKMDESQQLNQSLNQSMVLTEKHNLNMTRSVHKYQLDQIEQENKALKEKIARLK